MIFSPPYTLKFDSIKHANYATLFMTDWLIGYYNSNCCHVIQLLMCKTDCATRKQHRLSFTSFSCPLPPFPPSVQQQHAPCTMMDVRNCNVEQIGLGKWAVFKDSQRRHVVCWYSSKAKTEMFCVWSRSKVRSFIGVIELWVFRDVVEFSYCSRFGAGTGFQSDLIIPAEDTYQ